jgi:prevent-host-death family protein
MKTYTISEARENFATLIKQAEAGEQVLLTRRGKAVVSIQPFKKQRPKPGSMARAGFSVRIAPDFDDIPPGFEDYL